MYYILSTLFTLLDFDRFLLLNKLEFMLRERHSPLDYHPLPLRDLTLIFFNFRKSFFPYLKRSLALCYFLVFRLYNFLFLHFFGGNFFFPFFFGNLFSKFELFNLYGITFTIFLRLFFQSWIHLFD